MFQRFTKTLLLVLATAPAFAQNLNCTLRSKMTFPGQTLANICGYVHDGREYALIGAAQGIIFAEITNPDAPVQIAQIPGPNNLWKEIKTYQHWAYVTSEGGQGVQIVSMKALPNAPTLYHYYKGDGAIAGQLNKIHALHIDTTRGFLYLFGSNLFGGGAVVCDLKPDPYNPRYVGKFSDLGYIHDGFVDNDTLYASLIYAGQFAIVNMANKAAPQVINTQTTPNQFTHNTWLSDDHRTCFATDETANSFLSSWDISNPLDIKALDKIQSNPGSQSAVHNTHIRGNFAVTSWYKDGFTIVDVSRPDNLVQTGNYDTYAATGSGYDGCWGVYPFFPSGNIIASNIQGAGTSGGELYIITPNYVRACFLEGKITDGPTGNPLFGAKIDLLATPNLSENSSLSGIYKMGQLTPGTFPVRVSKAGYQTFNGEAFLENGSLTVLDVALFPAGNLTLSGFVRNGLDMMPVPGATVALTSRLTTLETQADALGHYAFSGLQPGLYDLFAGDSLAGLAEVFGKKIAQSQAFDLLLFKNVKRDETGQVSDFQCVPNPFDADGAMLRFSPAEAERRVSVFDELGKLELELALPAGATEISFGKNLPAGVHFLRGESGAVLRVVVQK